ncbi:MAG: guanylate kinase [Gemmatimonadota bacterium]
MTQFGAALPIRTFPVIFAAPSGAGKTSIARALATRRKDVEFSISATTRSVRPGESDGIDYFFRSHAEFRAMIDAGELLEWAEVHGNLYGTPRLNLERARDRHHFLLLDIDVQGSRQIKQAVPESVSIFVLPPSGEELAERLVGRGSEDDSVRRTRLVAARAELGAASEFDFVVVNENLVAAVDAVERIIDAEAFRSSRCEVLESHLETLIRGVDRVLEV